MSHPTDPAQRPERSTPDTDPPSGLVVLAPGVAVRPEALSFSFVSSSGPGGQNVNKKATKAQLRVALGDLPMHPEALERLALQARTHLVEGGVLLISADEFRSQPQNRRACLERLRELIVRALVRPKKRRATKPTKGSVRRRIDEKVRRGRAKEQRRRLED